MAPDLSSKQRDAMVKRWFDVIVGGYAHETERFLRDQADPFANPVGAALRDELGPIVDGVLSGRDPAELGASLDRVLRVRALQDMPPSAAVGIVLELKGIFDDVAGDASRADRDEFGRRVDAVLLTAFDVFNHCREQVYDIRVKEIRNRSLKVMERLNSWREQRAGGPPSNA
jgi:hypothetical protein